ncbi:GNAT family N-acetyltransferase [Halobacillus sp. K22]|uniref:GNAT family N-acetyltransferase n=1 Tax=Halobacillus sp. K22 TaxID=3457431 RepID=UPI003FCCF4F6
MIELQNFSNEDFDQLIDWIPSADFLMKWGGPIFEFPLDHKQLDSYTSQPDRLVYKAWDPEFNEVVGHISLGRIDKKNESARIGKVLVSPEHQNRGIGEQMIQEMTAIAFQELKLHKVALGVFDFNQPAIRCYEKAGFQKDGLLRDHRKVNGSFWNLMEMSLLRTEWDPSPSNQKREASTY